MPDETKKSAPVHDSPAHVPVAAKPVHKSPEPKPVEKKAENVQTYAAPVKFKTGKTKARKDKRDLLFSNYATIDVPDVLLGHDTLVGTNDWGMLGNDTVGDCVFAGAGHETMLWNAEAQVPVSITSADALADYSAVTGYNPKDPNSDQGTNVRDALKYRQTTGIEDAAKARHKIAGYVALKVGDMDQVKAGVYVFSAVGIGFDFPDSAMDQFNAGEPWTVVPGEPAPTEGHYVPVVGFDPATGYFYAVTWGRLQPVAPAFFEKYMDEGYALLSQEFLTNGTSIEGFDLVTLQADLAAIVNSHSPTPTPVPVVSPDEAFAAVLEPWVLRRHATDNKVTATAAKKWLAAKDL